MKRRGFLAAAAAVPLVGVPFASTPDRPSCRPEFGIKTFALSDLGGLKNAFDYVDRVHLPSGTDREWLCSEQGAEGLMSFHRACMAPNQLVVQCPIEVCVPRFQDKNSVLGWLYGPFSQLGYNWTIGWNEPFLSPGAMINAMQHRRSLAINTIIEEIKKSQ